MSPAEETAAILKSFGVNASAGDLVSHSPIDGQPIGRVPVGDAQVEHVHACQFRCSPELPFALKW